MANYGVLRAEADRFRIEQYKPDEAIDKYREALAIGGPNDRHIQQMIGVCYQLKHEYDESLRWHEQARAGASDYEDGNILRDMAEAYSKSGDTVRALDCISQSLNKLPYTQFPSEHAASLGFLARIKARMGEIQDAARYYCWADAILSQTGNRHIELYNKLHYAHALSCNKQRLKARSVALKGLILALKYGANPHRVRALALVVGDHKLDDYIRSKRHR